MVVEWDILVSLLQLGDEPHKVGTINTQLAIEIEVVDKVHHKRDLLAMTSQIFP